MKPIHYKRGYKYQLTKTYQVMTDIRNTQPIRHEFFHLDTNGHLTIFKSYAWDGATGGIDTKDFLMPSLVHDCFCQMINEGLLPRQFRAQADELLYKHCRAKGMSWARAKWIYHAVRFYADKMAKYEPAKEYTA